MIKPKTLSDLSYKRLQNFYLTYHIKSVFIKIQFEVKKVMTFNMIFRYKTLFASVGS